MTKASTAARLWNGDHPHTGHLKPRSVWMAPPAGSWWVGVSREAWSTTVSAQQARMALVKTPTVLLKPLLDG